MNVTVLSSIAFILLALVVFATLKSLSKRRRDATEKEPSSATKEAKKEVKKSSASYTNWLPSFSAIFGFIFGRLTFMALGVLVTIVYGAFFFEGDRIQQGTVVRVAIIDNPSYTADATGGVTRLACRITYLDEARFDITCDDNPSDLKHFRWERKRQDRGVWYGSDGNVKAQGWFHGSERGHFVGETYVGEETRLTEIKIDRENGRRVRRSNT
jgi:hypothetical protein